MQQGTDTRIAEIDNVFYNKNNLDEYGMINYQLDCSGIKPGEYYLQLTADVSGEAQYTLAKGMQEAPNGLAKESYKTLSFSEISIPLNYQLYQNQPNPFNPTTVINYSLEQTGHVSLKVFDITGREISVLVDGDKEAGQHSTHFDGSGLASGMYFYKMVSNKFTAQKKMLLIK